MRWVSAAIDVHGRGGSSPTVKEGSHRVSTATDDEPSLTVGLLPPLPRGGTDLSQVRALQSADNFGGSVEYQLEKRSSNRIR